MGQVDLLLASLAQESFDLVAAIGEGGGFRRSRIIGGSQSRSQRLDSCWRGGSIGERSVRGRQESNSVAIIWIEGQYILGAVTDHSPICLSNSLIRLIEKDIYSTLDSFAGHNGGIIASKCTHCPRTHHSNGQPWRFRAAIIHRSMEIGAGSSYLWRGGGGLIMVMVRALVLALLKIPQTPYLDNHHGRRVSRITWETRSLNFQCSPMRRLS